ncbi:unnamed protein product, partial [Iphiclides podalirius]
MAQEGHRDTVGCSRGCQETAERMRVCTLMQQTTDSASRRRRDLHRSICTGETFISSPGYKNSSPPN